MRRASAKYRTLLLRAKRELLVSLGVKMQSIAATGPVNEEDLAQVSHEEFVSLRLNGLDYEKLRMVDEALDRFAAGDFGLCVGCDEPIPEKRLQALPWARYCVACQERFQGEENADQAARSLEPVSAGPS
jgi:DnaK suppressor protein